MTDKGKELQRNRTKNYITACTFIKGQWQILN